MMMMMMWVCRHSSYIPSTRGTRWYQETNLCLRSKASSIRALTDLSIFPPWTTDSQVILDKASSTGPLLTTRNKPLPARQTIFNHNRTFVLAFHPPHLPPAPYITWILSPTTNDFTWTWSDLLSPHTWPPDDERRVPTFHCSCSVVMVTSVF